jgi:hypothetical protein
VTDFQSLVQRFEERAHGWNRFGTMSNEFRASILQVAGMLQQCQNERDSARDELEEAKRTIAQLERALTDAGLAEDHESTE